ncbi:hypothetical protein GQF61_16225 [Sphingobacterium sp. DK4209]|uniref:Uncharacterized protein n=1 Tax=Sphingobacterium zhuxiongii TaxID=2662364 RepID=A0A5Q0Q7G3_9SPHI|nr:MULTISPECIES: hypothetical protein [unclassified Sphingobacterium]MVZ67402.1 hypothetical protein [Sphingobacterium sp. DK4209]QGA25403.1 hypothetical protein GFH32_03280 [Sphingobacterium sp. dk4302]
MAIYATSEPTTPRELIAEGTYIARCYQMIHIGTVKETIQGDEKTLNKVRIGWELPTELKVFKEENGPQPLVISKEYTLSLHENAHLRKDLKSWRSKDFTEEEVKQFDISVLVGVPCLLTITHKKSTNGKVYEEIASISNVVKGTTIPEPINTPVTLEYDNWSEDTFNSLPNFIKEKVSQSLEYNHMRNLERADYDQTQGFENAPPEDNDGLPF